MIGVFSFILMGLYIIISLQIRMWSCDLILLDTGNYVGICMLLSNFWIAVNSLVAIHKVTIDAPAAVTPFVGLHILWLASYLTRSLTSSIIDMVVTVYLVFSMLCLQVHLLSFCNKV